MSDTSSVVDDGTTSKHPNTAEVDHAEPPRKRTRRVSTVRAETMSASQNVTTQAMANDVDGCDGGDVGASCRVVEGDARDLSQLVKDNSVAAVITSPPYPMVAMWDDAFRAMNPAIGDPAQWSSQADALVAFELMHLELDKV